MNIILFHVGDKLPDHIYHCLKQLRSENPTETVWFLHNKELETKVSKLKEQFDIHSVIVDPARFPIIDQYMGQHGPFWTMTMKRIPLIAEFVMEKQLQDIVIFENDVLIYYPINNILDWLRNNSHKNCLLTRCTDTDIATGFSYFYNSRSLNSISQFILENLPIYIMHNGFVNEMVLLSEYDKKNLGKCEALPTMPLHLQYDSMQESSFPYVFDPATWGQYVGGTPHNGKEPGWAENAHYIGKKILEGRYDIAWQIVDGKRKPYVKDLLSGVLTPLFNLHIHSKELHKYTSYE